VKWCFTECSQRETERETILYNKQFDKLFHDVSSELRRNSQRKFTAILGMGYGRKGNGEREGEVSKGVSLVTIQPFVWKKRVL